MLLCELLYDNTKAQVQFSELFEFTAFKGMVSINSLPLKVIEYIKRNPDALITLKNLGKYSEKFEGSTEQPRFWCFPPKNKAQESQIFLSLPESSECQLPTMDEENLNEMDIDEQRSAFE